MDGGPQRMLVRIIVSGMHLLGILGRGDEPMKIRVLGRGSGGKTLRVSRIQRIPTSVSH